MAFGILGTCLATYPSCPRNTIICFATSEDHKLSNVPGTGPLSAKSNQAMPDEAGELKRGTGKHSHVVLLPQPSDDPFDP